ncbi:hypothetical protein C8Q73DRAFT_116552 [Cubamyces lactineus]|nr:hypothetical protein C8Q73DRAFT_116552 [Cubamyces lactineus]
MASQRARKQDSPIHRLMASTIGTLGLPQRLRTRHPAIQRSPHERIQEGDLLDTTSADPSRLPPTPQRPTVHDPHPATRVGAAS